MARYVDTLRSADDAADASIPASPRCRAYAAMLLMFSRYFALLRHAIFRHALRRVAHTLADITLRHYDARRMRAVVAEVIDIVVGALCCAMLA